MSDGVVIQYQAVGNNNPNSLLSPNGIDNVDIRGKICVHEVGHYLGLRHIWGDGDCTQQDGIDDTPNATNPSSQYPCDTLSNTCADNIGVLGDLPDMQENYMDYSPEECLVAFTIGQAELMRGVIETHRWGLIDSPDISNIEKNKKLNITIYPNPSNGNITITGTTNGLVEVYSNNGQLVSSINTTDQKATITGLPNGIYFVRISNTSSFITKKIVVIHN